MSYARITGLFAFAVLLASACSDDGPQGPPPVGPAGGIVGGPCNDDRQCASRCREGMCTHACSSDADCPGGTACIDSSGGICQLLCVSSRDCPIDFVCDDRDRKGAAGRSLVCRR